MEYEEQIQTLKNLYEQKLHFDGDNIDENSIRQVYKSEVEDLKVSLILETEINTFITL